MIVSVAVIRSRDTEDRAYWRRAMAKGLEESIGRLTRAKKRLAAYLEVQEQLAEHASQ